VLWLNQNLVTFKPGSLSRRFNADHDNIYIYIYTWFMGPLFLLCMSDANFKWWMGLSYGIDHIIWDRSYTGYQFCRSALDILSLCSPGYSSATRCRNGIVILQEWSNHGCKKPGYWTKQMKIALTRSNIFLKFYSKVSDMLDLVKVCISCNIYDMMEAISIIRWVPLLREIPCDGST